MINNKTKLFLVFSLILITMIGISAVSATDVDTANSDQQLEETANSQEVVTSDDINVYTKTSNSNKSVSTQDELKGPFTTSGSFSDLNSQISEASDSVVLDKNYIKGTDENEITIDGKTITIDGNGAVIDLNNNALAFVINSNSNVTLKNIIIQNNNGTSSAIENNGILTFINVTLSNNFVKYDDLSGVIKSGQDTILTVINSSAYNNNATYGIFQLSSNAKATFENSDFANNSGNNAVCYSARYSSVNLTVNNCNFTNNTGSNAGGAINGYGGYIYVNNSIFTNNSANTRGGAVYLNGRSGSVTNSIFRGNYLTSTGRNSMGGAICINTIAYFQNNTMTDNYGANGTDIYVESGFVNQAILNFENVTGTVDDVILVKGNLTDDNGNTISGKNVTVQIGDDLSAIVRPLNGSFTYEVSGTLEPGNYTISGTYDAINTTDGGEIIVNEGNLEVLPSNGLNYAKIEDLVRKDTTGTITLDNFIRRGLAENNMTITKTVVIDANGNILDQKMGAAFILDNNATLTLKNMVVINANTTYSTEITPEWTVVSTGTLGAFVDVVNGTLILENVTVVNSTGENYGTSYRASLIRVNKNGKVSINNSLFENNEVAVLNIDKDTYGTAHSTGIMNNTIIRNTNADKDTADQGWIIVNGKLDIYNSIFDGNSGRLSGIYAANQQEDMIIQNCSFINNEVSTGQGGAIQHKEKLTVINSTFIGNKVTVSGISVRGGGAISSGGELIVTGSTFINNSVKDEGSIIFNTNGPLNITNSVLIPFGTNAAIYNENENYYGTDVVVANNNWWGTNDNPSQYVKSGTYWDDDDERANCDPVIVDTWVLMNATYEETAPNTYDIITTFNQTIDANEVVRDLEGNIPDGLEVTYQPTTATYTANPSYTENSITSTTVSGISIKQVKVIQSNEIIDFLVKETVPGVHVINDGNYSYYFNEDGTVNEEIIAPGSELQFDGVFHNRNITVTMPLNLTTYTTQAEFYNTTILLENSKATGTNITNIIVNNNNYDEAIISLTDVENISIKNNTLNQYNDEGITSAVKMNNVVNVILDGNNITTVGPDVDVNYDNYPISITNTIGIDVLNSTGVIIKNNKVITNKTGESSEYGTINGIYIHGQEGTASNYNVVDNNTIITEADVYVYSVAVMSGANNNNVTNNNITTISKHYANGIEFGGEARNNIADNNIINVTAVDMTYGFYISTNYEGSVSNNTVTNNNVTASASSNYLVELWSAYATNISNNVFKGEGDYSLGIGAYNARTNIIVNNTMDLIGYATNNPVENDNIEVETTGVKLIGESNANKIMGNNITVQSFTEEANAVNIINGVYNNVTDNYLVVTSLSGNLIGDNAVSNQDTDNIVENNIPVPPSEIIVTDDNYYDYFDENGNLIVDVAENPTIKLSGEIYNKNFTFEIPVNVVSHDIQGKLLNSSIQFLAGSDNSNFTGIIIDDDNYTDKAIYVTNVENITLADNNITVYNDVNSHGIVLNKTSGNTIKNNNLNVSGIAQPVYYESMYSMAGISNTSSILVYNSSNNVIENNNITTSANTSADNLDTIVGIEVTGKIDYNTMENYYSDNNVINNNNINTNGVNYAYGIKYDGQTTANNITNNNINTTAKSSAYGAFIDGEAYNTTIKNNTIDLSSDEFAYGVVLQCDAGLVIDSVVDSNTINATSDAVWGIELFKASYVDVNNNTINAIGNYSTAIAGYRADFNTITNNTITTSGNNNATVPVTGDIISPTNNAIQLLNSEYNNVTGNFVNASITNNDGIYAVNANGTNNRVTNNTLYTTGKLGNKAVNASNNCIVEDNLPVVSLGVEISGSDVTGLVNNTVTITVNVIDENGNNVTEGTVEFTDVNGNVLGTASVIEGSANISTVFNKTYDDIITVTYAESGIYTSGEGTLNANITKIASIVTINPIETVVDESTAITVTVVDANGNNVNGGKVIFKVNGKTLKDENDNLIQAAVVDGVATINYVVPSSWTKGIDLTAKYGGTSVVDSSTSEAATIKIDLRTATVQVINNAEYESGSPVQLTALVKDSTGKFVQSGTVMFKLNGISLKDKDGKTITATVNNGIAQIIYTESLSVKNYTVTAVFADKNYNRAEGNNNFTVLKTNIHIEANPVIITNNSSAVLTGKIFDGKNNIVQRPFKVTVKINGITFANKVTVNNGTINIPLNESVSGSTSIDNFKMNKVYNILIIAGDNSQYIGSNVTTVLVKQ